MSVDPGAKAAAVGVVRTMEVDMMLKRAAASIFASERRIAFFLAASRMAACEVTKPTRVRSRRV